METLERDRPIVVSMLPTFLARRLPNAPRVRPGAIFAVRRWRSLESLPQASIRAPCGGRQVSSGPDSLVPRAAARSLAIRWPAGRELLAIAIGLVCALS